MLISIKPLHNLHLSTDDSLSTARLIYKATLIGARWELNDMWGLLINAQLEFLRPWLASNLFPEYSKWFLDFKVCYRAVPAQPCHPLLFPPRILLPHCSFETTFPSSFLLFFKFTPTSEPRHTPGLQIDATYLLQKPPHSRRAWCAGFPLTNINNCLKRQRKMYKSREEEKGISFIKKLRKSINCNLILLFHVLKLSAITWSWFGLQRQWTKQKKNPLTCSLTFVTGGRSEVSLSAGDACAVTMIL